LELFLRNSRRVFRSDSRTPLVVEEIPEEHRSELTLRVTAETKSSRRSADLIETIYGLGYRLKPEQQEASWGSRGASASRSRLAPNLKQQTMAE